VLGLPKGKNSKFNPYLKTCFFKLSAIKIPKNSRFSNISFCILENPQ
jgi:hypothetical protein